MLGRIKERHRSRQESERKIACRGGETWRRKILVRENWRTRNENMVRGKCSFPLVETTVFQRLFAKSETWIWFIQMDGNPFRSRNRLVG